MPESVNSMVEVMVDSTGGLTGAADDRAVGIYIRVSTEEQATTGVSLAAQKEKLIAYCKLHNWNSYIVYEDAGISGSTITDRPALMKLLDDCKNQEIKTIVVYRLDRLSRSLRDIILTIDELRAYNVNFVSVTEQIDTTTAVGKLTFHMIGAFAEFERNIIKERIELGMAKKATEGYTQSRAPLGYAFENRALEVNPEEAELVKEIFKEYLQERSIGKVAKMHDLHRSLVHRVLTNVTYIGDIKWRGKIIRGIQDPIIDPQTFEEVRGIMDSNKHPQMDRVV